MIITSTNPSLDFKRVGELTFLEDGKHQGIFHRINVSSVFQPIYSLVHARIVGAEGLMRCTNVNGEPVSPMEMLCTKCPNESDSVLLDRLCRYLHVKNAAALLPDPCWLFLNVSSHTVIAGRNYGAFFKELLQDSGFAPSRIVVEIL